MNKLLWILPVVVVFFLGINSCGMKPSHGIPDTITAEQVMTVLDKRMAQVSDFSGRAKAKMSVGGDTESAIVYINYKEPDRFRVNIRGAFGVVLAVLFTEQDSFKVYVPSIKGYFVLGRDENVLDHILPDVRFDIKRITSIFSNSFLPADVISQSVISFDKTKEQAVLTVINGDSAYRYTVHGPDLLLAEEEFSQGDEVSWRIQYSDYTPSNGTLFPRNIILSERDKVVNLVFSKYDINSGLSDSDLIFEIPSNAERYVIEKNRFP
ncbi:MAG: DUF4292 domain-containing protein [Candidatus Latescibacteria bacterium]|nr:DUF4292 domain-containing protein [Candidatus Latescibacterota bacterium]